MYGASKGARFEGAILPYLDAAYNLARRLTRNDHDAEDLVQEACLRAFKFFDGFHGENGRAWLLTIVRNTWYTCQRQNRTHQFAVIFDEEVHSAREDTSNPEVILQQNVKAELLKQALEELPVEFREVLILRELEDLSYKEIAQIVDIPIGTVMSRLARARERLQRRLTSQMQKEV